MVKNKKYEATDFYGLGIAPRIIQILKQLKFTVPTPIQSKSIPALIEGKDMVGVARTGTGKTLAFGVPMLQRLARYKGRGLILLPTRELAAQVDEHIKMIGEKLGLRTAILIGGEPISKQIAALRRRPHIIIATPGRLIDCLERRLIDLSDVKILVLDEADRMLDMGFAPQIERIVKAVPRSRQTMLFSATMPSGIMRIASRHMSLPVRVEVSPSGTTAAEVTQEMIILNGMDKFPQLEKMLIEYAGSFLVFVRTKTGASILCRKIRQTGGKVAEIHSARSLAQRREALSGFKNGRFRILVATDIAARGLDIDDIEVVVNYDMPEQAEDYVHRIGRTARAGKSGRAVSFALPSQAGKIKSIGRLIQQEIHLTRLVKENKTFKRRGARKGGYSFY